MILFAGFAWFELIDPAPDDPARLAAIVLAYAALNLAVTLVFGYRDWSRRGEFLSVFFGMIARFAILQRRRESRSAICARLPGAKLAEAEPLPPSGVAVPAVCAGLGLVRRPVAHLLLARPQRHQPAGISRPVGCRRSTARAFGAFLALAAVFLSQSLPANG